MSLKFMLVSLVAAVGAQNSNPTPLWFLQSIGSGSFAERKAECKRIYQEDANAARSSSDGPIFIPEGEAADICIRFPPTEELAGGWRHDRGLAGACSNGCCEFLPPVSNQEELKSKPQPTWFESSTDCSDESAAKSAPILFKGRFEEAKSICLKQESGEFQFQNGQLGNCGGECCIFYAAPQ
jgi:hypothetical protein